MATGSIASPMALLPSERRASPPSHINPLSPGRAHTALLFRTSSKPPLASPRQTRQPLKRSASARGKLGRVVSKDFAVAKSACPPHLSGRFRVFEGLPDFREAALAASIGGVEVQSDGLSWGRHRVYGGLPKMASKVTQRTTHDRANGKTDHGESRTGVHPIANSVKHRELPCRQTGHPRFGRTSAATLSPLRCYKRRHLP